MANGQEDSIPTLTDLISQGRLVPEGADELAQQLPTPGRSQEQPQSLSEVFASGQSLEPGGVAETSTGLENNPYSFLERVKIWSPKAIETVTNQLSLVREVDDLAASAISALLAGGNAVNEAFLEDPTRGFRESFGLLSPEEAAEGGEQRQQVGEAIMGALDLAMRVLTPHTEENRKVSEFVLNTAKGVVMSPINLLINPRKKIEEDGLLVLLDVIDLNLLALGAKAVLRGAPSVFRAASRRAGTRLAEEAVEEVAERGMRALPPGPFSLMGPETDVITDRAVVNEALSRLDKARDALVQARRRPGLTTPFAQVRRARSELGLRPTGGGLPSPDAIPSMIEAAQRRIGRIDDAEREVVRRAYEAATRGRTKAPSFIVLREAPEKGALMQIRGDIPPVSLYIPDKKIGTRFEFLRSVSGVSDEVLGRASFALHGSTEIPKDPGLLRQLSSYLDDVIRGRSPLPATKDDILAIRRKFGPEAVEAAAKKAAKERPVRFAARTMKEALKPSPTHMVDVRDVGLLSLIRDFDKAVPEAAAIVRPGLRDYSDEVAEISDQVGELFRGVKEGSTLDRQVARILNGDYGDSARIISGDLPLPKWVKPRAREIAGEVRPLLDDLFQRIKASHPDLRDLRTVDNYLAWIRDKYAKANLTPPDLVRHMGRKTFNRHLIARSGLEAPEELSAIESLRAYIPAALRTIHLDPKIAELDDLVRRWKEVGAEVGGKIDLINAQRDFLLGSKTRMERFLDRAIVRTADNLSRLPGVNLNPGTRPAMRLSMLMSMGFYRGILGLNISAAANNLTQSVNTMARAGVINTLDGMRKMLTSAGRRAAKEADLSRQFRRLFEENRRFGKLRTTLDEVLFAPFNFAEFMNRGIAFHAGASQARNVARKAGRTLTSDELVQAGLRMASETQFVYDELARGVIFRGPIGRQFGILASFPIKQAEFLSEMAGELVRRESLDLVRYFAVTGAAALTLEKGLGVRMSALAPQEFAGIPIPGTEFAQQIEGAPLAVGPAGQLASEMVSALKGFISDDPQKTMRAGQAVLDGMSTMVAGLAGIPAVQTKELLQFWGDYVESQRRGEDFTRRKILPRGAGRIPFVRESPLGPRGDIIAREGSVGAGLLRLAGVSQLEAEQRFDFGRDYAKFLSERRQKMGVGADLAISEFEAGEIEEARNRIRDEGITEASVRQARRFANLDLADRLLESSSAQEQVEYFWDHEGDLSFASPHIRAVVQGVKERGGDLEEAKSIVRAKPLEFTMPDRQEDPFEAIRSRALKSLRSRQE